MHRHRPEVSGAGAAGGGPLLLLGLIWGILEGELTRLDGTLDEEKERGRVRVALESLASAAGRMAVSVPQRLGDGRGQ